MSHHQVVGWETCRFQFFQEGLAGNEVGRAAGNLPCGEGPAGWEEIIRDRTYAVEPTLCLNKGLKPLVPELNCVTSKRDRYASGVGTAGEG
jgi:hypothetical protein